MIFPSPVVLYACAAIGVGSVLVGFTVGYSIRDNAAKAATAKALLEAHNKQDTLQAVVNSKSAEYEVLKAQLDARKATDAPAIYKAFKDVSVPSSCVPPPAVVGLLADRIAAANAAASGKPSVIVQRPTWATRPVH